MVRIFLRNESLDGYKEHTCIWTHGVKKYERRLTLPTITAENGPTSIIKQYIIRKKTLILFYFRLSLLRTFQYVFFFIILFIYKDGSVVCYFVYLLSAGKHKIIYQELSETCLNNIFFPLYCLNKTYLGMSKTLLK